MAREQDRLWVGSMLEAYDRWLAPSVFRPFAQDLAQRAAQLAPREVLEIAAGTGVLTTELLAALPGAAVTAAGFCAGTPLRMEMTARGDLTEGTKVVAEEMTALLGTGPVAASMTAYVVEARPSPPLPESAHD